jgi:hypothetical protein
LELKDADGYVLFSAVREHRCLMSGPTWALPMSRSLTTTTRLLRGV